MDCANGLSLAAEMGIGQKKPWVSSNHEEDLRVSRKAHANVRLVRQNQPRHLKENLDGQRELPSEV